MKTAVSFAALTLALAVPAFAQSGGEAHEWGEMNVPDFEPNFPEQFRAPIEVSPYELQTEVLTDQLEHPWAVETLPDDQGYLVTERTGNLLHIGPDGEIMTRLSGVPQVHAVEQGGLLDVKLGPNFAEDRMVYLTYAKPMEGEGMSATAAGRGTLSEDLTAIEGFEDIWIQQPPSPSPMHYGSRIVFDGAGHAFITTGEHFTMQERDYAQHLDKTYGKVIRVNLDGSIPDDNPFVGNPDADDSIWSYGHRNIQGAAMRDGDRLYIIEHGPAGGDEINVPEPGENYGWPIVSYGERYGGEPIGSGEAQAPDMEQPLYYWDPVIAPGDMTFYSGDAFPEWEGDILIGGLVSGGLVRVALENDLASAEERLITDVGRTRDVEVLDDGTLLVVTDYDNGELIHVTPSGG
ncbi:PQQ-dependent sugar dehydrogenase [Tranquillimonas alkanivorans]|uniref:Glucose/arabinose dehydrogenase, beta-propeller fold n=1 Tax=Tranquillimonas alkanivorans TaxID=441119 RepID=A0A1I5ME39_9RHOB|nr:PQQ-dependent sugar dehydrogenase [Tranquillimonas alkanivorans]SFP07196.1 Glucose/arabinose dehydrogenase, beta-propeller fold [Tranquillimonas alkanivorans]